MYRDINGIEHESYSDACRYYGADTPEQAEAEARYYAELEREERKATIANQPQLEFDDIPF